MALTLCFKLAVFTLIFAVLLPKQFLFYYLIILTLCWKPTSDFLLVVKRNETPICKGLGDIGRFSITGSDVMQGAPNFKSDLIF